MRRLSVLLVLSTLPAFGSVARADSFGTGENQFTIDFVSISGSSNPTDEQAGDFGGHGIVEYDYRMGVYEITNDQWDEFVAINGAPTGDLSHAYNESFYDHGIATTDAPTNNVSWYEAAQMVN